MKKLLTVLFLSIAITANAQSTCKCRDTSAWSKPIDTVSSIPGASGWLVSNWEPLLDSIPHNPPSFTVKMMQKRYGKTSGYVQERTCFCDFHIKPQEKTDFDKLIDSLTK